MLYYELQWDSGTSQGTWSQYQVVSSSGTSITVSGLSSGKSYAFKYRAQNVHGWSAGYSPVLTAIAMRQPGQVSPVTTSMDADKVVI